MQAAAPGGPAGDRTHVFVLHVFQEAQLSVGSLGKEFGLKRAVQFLNGHFGTISSIDSRASGEQEQRLVSEDPGDIADPNAPQGWHTRSALSHSLCPGTLVLLRHTRFPQAHLFCPGTLTLPSPQRAAPRRGATCTPPASPPGDEPRGRRRPPRGPEPSRQRGGAARVPATGTSWQQGTKRKRRGLRPAAAPPRPPAPSLGRGAQPCPCPFPLTRRLRRRRSPRAAGPGSGPALPRGFW